MHISENEGIENKCFVVTGGLGFVGATLCLELVRRGARLVKAFDLRTQSPWSDHLRQKGVICIQGDVTRKKEVEKALRGADCVFHLASYGMSGKEMLQYSRVDEVNINGTCHILDACIDHHIGRLVYVSTYNVVFGGKEIVNGNERLPHFPMEDHVDPYGRSKAIAEQLVIKYNGRSFSKETQKCLYTCAIRPAAIYGPGEERHLPRIISFAKLGLIPFKIGSPDVKMDWVYVDNLVLALLLASIGLLDDIPGKEGIPVAAGKAYFISDGSPVNSFEFLRPLLKSLDYELPERSLPVPQALLLGNFFWGLYSFMHPWLNKRWLPQPFILPTEVHKVGVTHYFSYIKAKEELGYIPMVTPKDGMAATISYWKEQKRRSLDGPTLLTWALVLGGMVALFGAAFLPDFGPIPLIRGIGLFVFRSVWALQVLFVVSVVLHIGEAMYAWHLAKKVDASNSRGWFWQTFALGFFSLRLLKKRAKE